MTPGFTRPITSVAIIGLSLTLSVSAQSHGDHRDQPPNLQASTVTSSDETYYQYKHNSVWILAHILLMSVSWIIMLPMSVVLSTARSRYSRIAQVIFLSCNAVGLIFGLVYNIQTPDLYLKNAHHKLGWAITLIVTAQVISGILFRLGKPESSWKLQSNSQEGHIGENESQRDGLLHMESLRFSQDSGHGTISISGSRTSSCSEASEIRYDYETESEGLRPGSVWNRHLSLPSSKKITVPIKGVFKVYYDLVDRTILLFGFAALCTGWVTYGGLFKAGAVFSGLAHFIKGSVFFWFGILSLSRWAGSFQDIGWAWNVRLTTTQKFTPSAEFMESFLIFVYGSTNVFLEHLAAWGHEWSAVDLEHISLTIMFIGGGLFGMLIESRRLREVLNQGTSDQDLNSRHFSGKEFVISSSPATTINPIPALIVILLGKMMSAHHQESMVSTMMHAQWGNLLMGAGVTRIMTYIVLFLSPSKSRVPSRPPTELLTSFGLMAGGLIFMASARDVVETIELHKLDAMFVFTVTMGLVMLLMSWIIGVLAIKGWAVRLERRSTAYEPLSSLVHGEP